MNKIKIFSEKDVENFTQKCYKLLDLRFLYLSKTYDTDVYCEVNTILSHTHYNKIFKKQYQKHLSISKQIILKHLPKKDLLKLYEEN